MTAKVIKPGIRSLHWPRISKTDKWDGRARKSNLSARSGILKGLTQFFERYGLIVLAAMFWAILLIGFTYAVPLGDITVTKFALWLAQLFYSAFEAALQIVLRHVHTMLRLWF